MLKELEIGDQPMFSPVVGPYETKGWEGPEVVHERIQYAFNLYWDMRPGRLRKE